MYQSIASLNNPPPGPGEFFWEDEFPTPQAQGKLKTPTPWGRIIVPTPHIWGNYFQKSKKRPTKHETEIKKNSTEMLILLEILKQ